MNEASPTPEDGLHTLVILLAQELLNTETDADRHRVVSTLLRAGRSVRVLMRVQTNEQFEFAGQLRRAGVNLEILVGASVELPPRDADLAYVVMPQGPKEEDTNNQDAEAKRDAEKKRGADERRELNEFALALSDVLLADATCMGQELVRRARSLGKPVIEPGEPLPPLPSRSSVSHGLDPDAGWWRRRFRYIFGRLEQCLMEFLAIDLGFFGSAPGGGRWSAVVKCLNPKRRPRSYFPATDAVGGSPDDKANDPRSPIVGRYELLDRSALYGSSMQRDQIWITHILAASAVFAAVLGAISILCIDDCQKIQDHFWPIFEFVALFTILIVVFSVGRCRLHDRWTACRLGAEQLRIARLCLPALVVPPALSTRDKQVVLSEHSEGPSDRMFLALSEVKRAIRDHGLPRLPSNGAPRRAAQWAHFLVIEQLNYHTSNHRKLERAEKCLRAIMTLSFLLVIAVVFFELVPYLFKISCQCLAIPKTLLVLCTAAGPAVPAALHSVATRLSIVHRIDLSATMMQELQEIANELADMTARAEVTEQHWPTIRSLTLRAAGAMGRENTSWHGLVRLQQDVLPA